jgi:ubiquinol-cytochrome c reductase iron-sulfur subunit
MTDKPPRRRDLLTTAAFCMAGIGGVLALYPFIAALSPPADERARRVVFSLAELQGVAPSLLRAGTRTLMVFRRTPEELALLKNPPEPLIDRARVGTNDPADTRNWHRSLKPEIAVMSAVCTRDDCIVKRFAVEEPELKCPCCGARYDLAGRVVGGPGPRNLAIPPYAFIDETAIAFPEFS